MSCSSKCKCHRRNKHCSKKSRKRAKKTHVAGANCCSSFKNIFSC